MISPGHNSHFNDCLAERLRQLQTLKDGDEVSAFAFVRFLAASNSLLFLQSFAEERWRDLECESPTIVSIPVPQRGKSVEIDEETMFS